MSPIRGSGVVDGEGEGMGLAEWVQWAAQALAAFAEVCGALVITYAVTRAAMSFIVDAVRGPAASVPRAGIRLGLGRGLTLALEFLLAADIMRTAVAPTWNDIAMLAAIVAIRTVLNYFLDKELERAEGREQQDEGERGGERGQRAA